MNQINQINRLFRGWRSLGAWATLTFLLRRTIRHHLRRSRPEKIINVFHQIHLRFFRACGLASGRTSFASSRTAKSDRLLAAWAVLGLVVMLSFCALNVSESVAQGDLELGKKLARKLRASNASLVVAVGLKAALAAKVEIVDVPIVYM